MNGTVAKHLQWAPAFKEEIWFKILVSKSIRIRRYSQRCFAYTPQFLKTYLLLQQQTFVYPDLLLFCTTYRELGTYVIEQRTLTLPS